MLSLTSKDASQRLDRLTVGETCDVLPLKKEDADLKDVKSLCPNMLFSPLLVFPQEKKNQSCLCKSLFLVLMSLTLYM